MTTFDRSKFKAANTAILQQEAKAAEAIVKSGYEKTEYHKIDAGQNIFRLYPAHPDSASGSFAFQRVTHRLEMELPNQEGKIEKKARFVFNGRIHGGYPKDIVEEYIRLVKENGERVYNAASQLKAYLEPINNYRTGIQPQLKWMMYADKVSVTPGKLAGQKPTVTSLFGILEISNAGKDQLNKISMSEAATETIQCDPFTDPDQGRAFIIEKHEGKDVKPKDVYSYKLDTDYDKATMMIRMFPLSDEQLTKFMEAEMLEKRYTSCYRRKDFEMAVQGLLYFDSQLEYGLTDTPEWQALLTEFDQMIPHDSEDEESEDDAGGTGDKLDRMGRDELKQLIRAEQLGIVPRQTMSDDDLRAKIREARAEKHPETNSFPPADAEEAGDSGERDTLEQDQQYAEQDREVPQAKAATGAGGGGRMASLREKAGKTNQG